MSDGENHNRCWLGSLHELFPFSSACGASLVQLAADELVQLREKVTPEVAAPLAQRVGEALFAAAVSEEKREPPDPATVCTVAALPQCTGLTARWCPVCGTCACGDTDELCQPGCPLHDPDSPHGERSSSTELQCNVSIPELLVPSECECEECEKVKDLAQQSDWSCEQCGFSGRPNTVECACYESFCNLGSPGLGCWHGLLTCPLCEDGERALTDFLPELLARVTAPEKITFRGGQCGGISGLKTEATISTALIATDTKTDREKLQSLIDCETPAKWQDVMVILGRSAVVEAEKIVQLTVVADALLDKWQKLRGFHYYGVVRDCLGKELSALDLVMKDGLLGLISRVVRPESGDSDG